MPINTVTEQEAKEVIYQFYKLMDGKPRRGYLIDFFELLDENVVWRYKDFVFDGYRGFEDHQEGKRKMFDESHDIQSMDISFDNNNTVVKTVAHWQGRLWEAPCTESQLIKAIHEVTWIIKRSEKTNKPVIASHIATKITITEGKMPAYLSEEN